jgi:hypothetical protein
MKTLAILAFVVAGLVAATPAKADQTEYVDLTFQSGATFVGTLDFNSNYSQITGVSGTLTDYISAPYDPSAPITYGGPGDAYLNFQSGSTDYFDWIWPGNSATDSVDNFGTYLMDGTSAPVNPDGTTTSDYLNLIAFTYVVSGTSNVTFALNDNDGNTANISGVEINYDDPLVSGSISSISPTPEPSSLLLLGSGLLGLAFVAFRKAKPSGMVLHS